MIKKIIKKNTQMVKGKENMSQTVVQGDVSGWWGQSVCIGRAVL